MDLNKVQDAWLKQQRKFLRDNPDYVQLDPQLGEHSGPDLDKIAEATKMATTND